MFDSGCLFKNYCCVSFELFCEGLSFDTLVDLAQIAQMVAGVTFETRVGGRYRDCVRLR